MTPGESGIHKLTPKRKRKRKNNASDFDVESVTSTRSYNRSKRKLAKMIYEELLPENSQQSGSKISLDILTDEQPGHSIKYAKHAKTALKTFAHSFNCSEEEKRVLHRRFLNSQSLSYKNATVVQVISILKLSLQILGITISNGDIARWCDEGSVSILTAEKLIPPGNTIVGDNKRLFINRLDSRIHMARSFYHLARFLDAYKKPCIASVIMRLIDDLNLPNDIRKVTDLLLSIDEPQLPLNSKINIEGRAIAFIIFSLKLLFGLDDVTENNLSIFAQSINRNTKVVEKTGEQFVWTDWMRHMVKRKALLSRIHQPTRTRLYKNSSIGGMNPFLLQWKRLNIKHSFERVGNMKINLNKAIQRMLNDFVEPLEEPKTKPYKNGIYSYIDKGEKLDMQSKSLMYLLDSTFRKKIIKKLGFIETEALCREFKISQFNKRNVSKVYTASESTTFKLDLIDTDESSFTQSTNTISDDLDDEYICEANTIYKAGGLVWLFHDLRSEQTMEGEGEFLTLARNLFSTNFLWLLKECSLLIGQNLRDIYKELVNVEETYLFHVTNIKKRHGNKLSW